MPGDRTEQDAFEVPLVNDDSMELPVRDPAAAIQAVGGNADLARKLFSAFLESMEPHWQEIRQRHQAADWVELRNSSHRLHGAAAYCGVPAIKAASRELELAAGAGALTEINRCMQSLEREIERLAIFAGAQE